MFRIFLTEFRRTFFHWVFLIVAVVGSYVVYAYTPPVITVWWSVPFALEQSLILNVIFVTGFAAWEGIRTSRRRMVMASRLSAKAQPVVRFVHLLAILLWVTLAWLVYFLALVGWNLWRGPYGAPDIWPILYSLLILLVFTTFGFVMAVLIGQWWVIPIVVTVPLVINLLIPYLPFYRYPALNPFFMVLEDSWTVVKPMLFPSLVLLSVGVLLILLVLMTYKFRWRYFFSSLVGLVGLVMLVTGSSLVVAQGRSPSTQLSESRMPFITVQNPDKTLTISIMEQYKPVAGELVKAWSRVASLFSESSLRFSSLKQASGVEPGSSFGPLVLDAFSSTKTMVDTSINWAIIMFRTHGAYKTATDALGAQGFGPGDLVLRAWLLGQRQFPGNLYSDQADFNKALNYLYSLSPTEARQWMAEHVSQLYTGLWQRKDFNLAPYTAQ